MKRGRPKKQDPTGAPNPLQAKTLDGIPTPPAHLDDIAKRVFTRVATILAEMGVWSLADADMVAQYSELYSLGLNHKKRMDDNGSTFTTEKGYQGLSPDYLIWRDCGKSCQKLLNDLGMSPAARTRVAVLVKQETDELVEFLKRGKSAP